MFVAMQWDHSYLSDTILWVVMECAGLREEENGAIQALPPRRDIAYFLRPASAKLDAENFARLKNAERAELARLESGGYRAFPWDHSAGQGLMHWAVLRADRALPLGREDVAYFVCESTARDDAALFEQFMNRPGLADAG